MAPTKLAIFDVDGTLLHSNAADEACFVQAFCDALGFEAIDMPGRKTGNGSAHIGPFTAAWFKDSEGNVIGLGDVR